MIILLNTTGPFVPTAWCRITRELKGTTIYKYSTPQSVTRLEVDSNIHIPNCELIGIIQHIDFDRYFTYLDPSNFAAVRVPQVVKVFYNGLYYDAAIESITYDPQIVSTILALECMTPQDAMTFLNSVKDDLIAWLAQNT